jgi:DNA (cytosine-5)-methyltransferase 1
MTLRIGSLCSGYRGLDTAVEEVFGGTTAWVSDIDPGANKILAHHWPATPNIGDLTTADWEQVEPVDIVCGGYPCQPFSLAGELKGTDDERHLWPYIARALRVLRPRYAIFENVANHLRIGFDTVLADLADLGFDAEWCVVRADEVGAPHQRRRLFFLATAADAPHLGHERGGSARGRRVGPADHGVSATDATSLGRGEGGPEPAGQQGRPGTALGRGAAPADPDGDGREEQQRSEPGVGPRGDVDRCGPERWGRFAPAVARWEAATGHPAPWATDAQHRLSPRFVEWMMGLPAGHVTDVPEMTRTQQLKALGNGVVPQQAAAALRLLVARREHLAVAS